VSPEQLRSRWRNNARRRRLRKQEAASLAAGCCQVKRNGSGKVCGHRLEARHKRDGYNRIVSTSYVCPSCDRRRAGVCQRCPRPVKGRVGFALYCDDAECQRIVRKAYRHGWDPRRIAC
jgi:hypothetical protein